MDVNLGFLDPDSATLAHKINFESYKLICSYVNMPFQILFRGIFILRLFYDALSIWKESVVVLLRYHAEI
jgi:hypothetical protein